MTTANITYWQSVFREAERELDTAMVKSALDAAARKLMRAKRELRALGATWDEVLRTRMGKPKG